MARQSPYVQGLVSGPAVELSWVNIDGIGIVIDEVAGFSALFDIAN
ncbi:MAG: hypothetical protein O3B43_01790 [Chloroflexi bacterium]|nr:hypothetical protein [Chloroflexota bacterium]